MGKEREGEERGGKGWEGKELEREEREMGACTHWDYRKSAPMSRSVNDRLRNEQLTLKTARCQTEN